MGLAVDFRFNKFRIRFQDRIDEQGRLAIVVLAGLHISMIVSISTECLTKHVIDYIGQDFCHRAAPENVVTR